jgi:NitT/TauT family transport system substrate-binding protein
MGYVGEAPATAAVANGVARVRVLAQVNTEGSALVVGKSSGFAMVKDLVGANVAVPGHATVQDFLLKKALVQNTVDARDLAIMVLKPPEMIGALGTAQIGAFIAWEPYPARAITMGIGRVLASSRDIWKDHPCCVLVADERFLEKRSKEAKAMVRAHVKATDFINTRPLDAAQIAVKYTGMDENTIRLAMNNVKYTYMLSRKGELEYVEFLTRMRYIGVDDPEKFVNSFLDGGFIKEITGR